MKNEKETIDILRALYKDADLKQEMYLKAYDLLTVKYNNLVKEHDKYKQALDIACRLLNYGYGYDLVDYPSAVGIQPVYKDWMEWLLKGEFDTSDAYYKWGE